jgi:drug/metabolite transporter (DMT)-like permease
MGVFIDVGCKVWQTTQVPKNLSEDTMIPVILLYALFASLFGLSKATLEHCEPIFLIGSRMAFAGVLLVTHQWFFNRRMFMSIPRKAWFDFACLGVIAIYLTNVCEIWGIQRMASAKACFIYSVSPFLSGLLSYILFREVLSKRKWLGMLVGFIGLIPLQLHSLQTGLTEGSTWLGEFALLTAVVTSVYGWILLKQIVTRYGQSLLLANGFAMFIGGSLALLHSFVSGETWSPVPVSDMDQFLMNTLAMCLISNIVCYNLYGYLLKRYSATFMSFAGLITPLFASLFGWFFLDEHLTWHFVISFLLFVFGLSLYHRDELEPLHTSLNPSV